MLACCLRKNAGQRQQNERERCRLRQTPRAANGFTICSYATGCCPSHRSRAVHHERQLTSASYGETEPLEAAERAADHRVPPRALADAEAPRQLGQVHLDAPARDGDLGCRHPQQQNRGPPELPRPAQLHVRVPHVIADRLDVGVGHGSMVTVSVMPPPSRA